MELIDTTNDREWIDYRGRDVRDGALPYQYVRVGAPRTAGWANAAAAKWGILWRHDYTGTPAYRLVRGELQVHPQYWHQCEGWHIAARTAEHGLSLYLVIRGLKRLERLNRESYWHHAPDLRSDIMPAVWAMPAPVIARLCEKLNTRHENGFERMERALYAAHKLLTGRISTREGTLAETLLCELERFGRMPASEVDALTRQIVSAQYEANRI